VHVPSVQEVQRAFQGKGPLPRTRLLEQLQRAGSAADQAELVITLATELQQRIERTPVDAVDLQFVSLLSGYTSAEPPRLSDGFLSHADSRVALSLLLGWLDRGHTPDWSQIERLTQHPDCDKVYGVRRAVITAAERSATPGAVEWLILTAEHTDGQLKYAAVVALTRVTGQPFGGSATKWRTWWDTARVDLPPGTLPPKPTATPPEIVWHEPVPKFFNAPIFARRLLFILDRSASMASTLNGEPRIDRLRQEFEQAILKLPPGTEFNVLVYHDSVQVMAPGYLVATTENKRHAIAFAERVFPERLTACYDALAIGLQNHFELEAIYFLSDGEPTTGSIVDMPEIVDAITAQNRFKQTSIYTLGIDARGVHKQFLQELASRNFGEFFLIR